MSYFFERMGGDADYPIVTYRKGLRLKGQRPFLVKNVDARGQSCEVPGISAQKMLRGS